MTEDSRRRRQVLALSGLAFIGGLGGGVVFPILPLVGLQLGIPAALIGLILALNRITRLAVNPITGIVVDRFGARWPLIVGLLIEALSTLCFYAGVHSGHAAAWFLAGRALWGVGSSLLMVGALTAALVIGGESGRGLSSAKVRMSLGFGVPAGLVLGGVIAARYSPGAAFLTAAGVTFLGVLVGLRFGPQGSARAPYVAGVSASSPASTLRKLLRRGPLWNVWLFNFCIFFSVQGAVLASLVLLVRDRHLALAGSGIEGTAGILMAMMVGSSALVSWYVGKRIDRHRRKTPSIVTGALLLIVGFACLAVSGQAVGAALALALIGIGTGGINVPLILIIGDLVPATGYGRAIGIYQVLGDFGGSLGPIVGLEALQRYGATEMLLGLTAALTVTLPLAARLWRRERRQPAGLAGG